ncbi:MAG TPA: hypothetical protein V6D21_05810 [Candidatus Obscuribacterales bacterium]
MLDLSNEFQWQLIQSQSLIGSGEEIIHSFPLPFLSRYLKAIATTTKPTLRYAGILSLMVGSINSNNPVYATSGKLLFGKSRLFDFDLIEQSTSSQFHLIYVSPYWVKNVQLQVWQYQDPQ